MKKTIRAFVCLFVLPVAVLAQAITVRSPNGGESWEQATTRAIAWTFSNVTGNVRIVLYNGAERVGIIRDSVPVAAGAIDWVVGDVQGGTAAPGNNYKVRIRLVQSDVFDASDRPFTIAATASPPPTTPAPPTTPPPPVAPAPAPLAQAQAIMKMPPKLLAFSVNDDEAVTTDMYVRFCYRALGGASHFRYGAPPTWKDWQPLAPGQDATGYLLMLTCAQEVQFQVKNQYGGSNVLTDGIIFRYPKNHTVAASIASGHCKAHGWTFAVSKKDCENCARIIQFPLDGTILCEIRSLHGEGDEIPQGHKCEFELFGGRQLRAGWEFVSYELVLPIGIGAGRENGYAILKQPAPGDRDITLRIRLWHDILRYVDGISFTVRSITLKGPCDLPVSEAFQ